MGDVVSLDTEDDYQEERKALIASCQNHLFYRMDNPDDSEFSNILHEVATLVQIGESVVLELRIETFLGYSWEDIKNFLERTAEKIVDDAGEGASIEQFSQIDSIVREERLTHRKKELFYGSVYLRVTAHVRVDITKGLPWVLMLGANI